MKYLHDTCLISELVKTAPIASVIKWVEAQGDDDMFLSVITVGEIRKGIEMARPNNLAAALRYERWLDELTAQYAGRLLPLDEAAAQIWGALSACFPDGGVEDLQIAAIAISRDMVVVTRNVTDFAPLGVQVHNPFLPS